MTAAGREFLDADILRKKDLFRAAALERVPLLKKIVSALEAKTDRTLPDEFFEDLLDEHFSEDETKLQLETAINWGRYAEMFDHDSRGQRFFIPQEAVAGAAK
jgi:NitT/TauT family transport system ATP-binding protein